MTCTLCYSQYRSRFVNTSTRTTRTSVYREKKHPYDCFTSLSEDKGIPMTALWCPAFSNHG